MTGGSGFPRPPVCRRTRTTRRRHRSGRAGAADNPTERKRLLAGLDISWQTLGIVPHVVEESEERLALTTSDDSQL
jgi:hypothetical protein